MKCKKCNSEIDDKLLICPKCGAILKEEMRNIIIIMLMNH